MNGKAIDQPAPVRQGEELDLERLRGFLADKFGDHPLTLAQFPRGYSNLTYFLKFGDREWVLRRPPIGADIKTAHDMGREFRVLSHLAERVSFVPRPILYEPNAEIIGAPFYIMERIRGVILRATPPRDVVLDEALMKNLSESFVNHLVELHGVDYRAAGLETLGRPEGYIRRQVEGWSKRYFKAKTHELPEMEQAAAWLRDHMPSETEATLIHNDYKYDNLVLDPRNLSRIIAVLDWEMATVGDPFMDLGTSLGYWAESGDPKPLKGFGLTALAGNLNREEVWRRYCTLSGRKAADPVFYFVFGLFKLAVIGQQIYARYHHGLTRDSRFADLIHLIRNCAEMAVRAIKNHRISGLY